MSVNSQTDDGAEWYAALVNVARKYTTSALEALHEIVTNETTADKDRLVAIKLFIQLSTSKDALNVKDVRWESMSEAEQVTHLRSALSKLESSASGLH